MRCGDVPKLARVLLQIASLILVVFIVFLVCALENSAMLSVLLMWRMGANTIALDGEFKPLVAPPYNICSGFYGCQRAACAVQARPDAFYVGMFFYSAPESCAALTNKKASADLLPVDSKPLRKLYDGLTISYGILTATAAVTILLPTHPAIPASVLGVSVATQVAAGVTWLIYMRKLQVMFGEQPPQYLWRSVITLNVIVLLATVVTHALVISERFPKKQQDVNDPEKLPFVTARAEL